MRKLHFISVYSCNPAEACDTAETFISGYGNENNYYQIGGCISEEDEVYDYDLTADVLPSHAGYNTLKMVAEFLRICFTPQLDKLGLIEEIVKPKPDWDFISETALIHGELRHVDIDSIKLFEDELFAGKYEEFGLTQCPYDREEEIAHYKNYLVFVSMHS